MAITFPRALPRGLKIRESRFQLSANTALFESPANRTVQAVSRPGEQWRGLYKLAPVRDVDAREIKAWLASMNGPVGTFKIGDPDGFFPGGTAKPGGGLVNYALRSQELDQSPWADIGTPIVTADTDVAPDTTTTADSIEDNDAAAFEGRSTTVSVAPDELDWVVSIFVKKEVAGIWPGLNISMLGGPGAGVNATPRWNSNSGAALSNVTVLDHDANYWRVYISLKNTGRHTTMEANVFPAVRTSDVSGDDASAVGTSVFWGLQVEPGTVPTTYEATTSGPLVKGASQTGTSLTTDGWLASQTGLLLPGDYVEVAGQLKMITKQVDSDGSGNATLNFRSALHASPAGNDPIILENARGVFRLEDDDSAAWDSDALAVHGISFSFVEVLETQ